MARKITIPLSDALEDQIRVQAAARGGQSLDECALAILTEALLILPLAPCDPAALEAELRKGLSGPSREPSADDWACKKTDLTARYPRGKAG